MVVFMHTSVWGSMVGFNHLPRVGELVRIPSKAGLDDERDGLYEVAHVMHTTGIGRVDLYADRVGNAPERFGWDDVMEPLLPSDRCEDPA